MIQLKEAIIGRDNSKNASMYKELKNFSDLKFGDIIQVYENDSVNADYKEGVYIYIYLPKATCDKILKNEGFLYDVTDDAIIRWVPKRVSVDNTAFKVIAHFKANFPFHRIYQSDCKIEHIIGHYDNYRNIKNSKELKAVLKKYNR